MIAQLHVPFAGRKRNARFILGISAVIAANWILGNMWMLILVM
jgi:hypothetical protein